MIISELTPAENKFSGVPKSTLLFGGEINVTHIHLTCKTYIAFCQKV